jgi:hypothetical protein
MMVREEQAVLLRSESHEREPQQRWHRRIKPLEAILNEQPLPTLGLLCLIES